MAEYFDSLLTADTKAMVKQLQSTLPFAAALGEHSQILLADHRVKKIAEAGCIGVWKFCLCV